MHERIDHFLELGAAKALLDRAARDLEAHRRLVSLAQALLGGLGLESRGIPDRAVAANLFGRIGEQKIDQRAIHIVAAEVSVAVSREHFEDALFDIEDRDIERATAEVVDRDLTGR